MGKKELFELLENGSKSTHECEVKMGIVMITPALAGFMLEHNSNNRRMNADRYQSYKRDMERGDWRVGPPIMFDRNGVLIDGQTRLQAIKLSEEVEAVPIVVQWNLNPATFKVIDIGRKRSLNQMMQLAGIADYNVIPAAIRLLHTYMYSRGLVEQKSARPGPTELMDLFKDHQSISKSVAPAMKSTGWYTRTKAVFLHYVFSQVDPDEADGFFLDLGKGENLSAGDPVLALRNYMHQHRSEQKKWNTKRQELAIAINTWNARRDGLGITRPGQLHWRPDQAFPAIIGISKDMLT